MGSTIVAARSIAALNTLKGQFYCLFSQTYESNSFPRTPSWGCNFFGTAEACMRRIIVEASATEGGILKEVSGQVSPSAFIKHWRREFNYPMTLKNMIVRANFGTSYRELPFDKKDAVCSLLDQHGLELHENTVILNLFQNSDVFQALIETHHLSAWKFLGGMDFQSPCQSNLIYAPELQNSPYEVLPVRVWYIDQPGHEREHWLISEDGKKTYTGWAYNTIECLIRTYAVESERQRPGSAENTIRLIRKTVANASLLPDDCSVSINRSAATENWQKTSFDSLARKLQRECSSVSTTIGEIRKSSAIYDFAHMPENMVAFPGFKKYMTKVELLAA